MPFLILSAGRDPDVLKQRNATLSAEGYRVAAASDSSEIVEKLLNGDFDLVLLCQSIPDDDRRRLARIVTSYTPSTPVIVISDSHDYARDHVPRAVNCLPEQVMAAVRSSLLPRTF
jgi:CheY-like chemotaxis protein